MGNPVNSEAMHSDSEYIYPSNKEKVFSETVDEFYKALRELKYPVHQKYYQKYIQLPKQEQRHMDTNLFKEMTDASVSFRKRVLFSEVEKFNYLIFYGNSIHPYPDIDINYHKAVSPERHVYFFYSLKDTAKEFRGRYAIYDVETKKILAAGNTYMPKTSPKSGAIVLKNNFTKREASKVNFDVDKHGELSIKQAVELAFPQAFKWNTEAQLLHAVNIDLDKHAKSIGSSGKRKYWNIAFGVPETNKFFLVTIYEGKIKSENDLTVINSSPYPKNEFIKLEGIKHDSPELLKRALKMNIIYPGKDWAKGYNFMLIKDKVRNINLLLVIGWNSDQTEMKAMGFNVSTGEYIGFNGNSLFIINEDIQNRGEHLIND